MNQTQPFDKSALPLFSGLDVKAIPASLKQILEQAENELLCLLDDESAQTWETLISPIENRQDQIQRFWSPVSHLHGVANDDDLRKAYDEGLRLLTDYHTRCGQNTQLYQAYEHISFSPEYAQLSQAQKKTIEHALRDFRLSGVALDEQKKQRFKEIKARLSSLTTQFSNNVLDATHGWFKHIDDEADLAGLPESAVASAAEQAQAKNCSGWVLTLDAPVYLAVMTQLDKRELRREFYTAFSTRASDQGPTAGQWDNSALMDDILELRQEMSALLGFKHYAELSLASKMAESSEQVIDFLLDLSKKSRPFAEQEWAELQAFAAQEYGIDALEAWDVPYYSEKLKQARYAISQEVLRPYFPLEHVLCGLFRVAEALFGVTIAQQSDFDAWHSDARFYVVSKDDVAVAAFYTDLFARQGKRGGAWMGTCQNRRVDGEQIQLPIAYLVCNFSSPVDDQPALLTHSELTTLFHEFGHGLHHMLTEVDVASVSGINGVAWDAVELPSQFMENFCWDREVLGFLSRHHQSGEALPSDMLDNMLAAKHFQAGMQMLRQIEFALFDMRIHKASQEAGFPGIQAVLDQVRDQVALVTPPSFNRFQHGFSHIFAGGYAAGYYSYKWAELLSADAYAAFEEALAQEQASSVLNDKLGQAFLEHILAKGGSEDPMVLFKAFRGREPSIEALLRHSGFITDVAA